VLTEDLGVDAGGLENVVEVQKEEHFGIQKRNRAYQYFSKVHPID
jgi:hypothetical protein